MPAASARLFLALWPEPEVREGLAAWRDGWTFPRAASPVHSERLHLTLHFLGDVDAASVPELIDALRVPVTPFQLRFGRNVLWPHGIAVLEPDTLPAPLLDLHAALADRVGAFGLALDARPYKPHVTLARRAAAATPLAPGPPIAWHIDRYALMQSDAGYHILQSYGSGPE